MKPTCWQTKNRGKLIFINPALAFPSPWFLEPALNWMGYRIYSVLFYLTGQHVIFSPEAVLVAIVSVPALALLVLSVRDAVGLQRIKGE